MADPTDTPTIDDITTTLLNIANSGGTVNDIISKSKDLFVDLIDRSKGLKTTSAYLKEASAGATDFFNAISDGNVAVQKIALNSALMLPLVQTTLQVASAFDAFGTSAENSSVRVSDAFKNISVVGDAVFSHLPFGLDTIGQSFLNMNKIWAGSAQAAQDYESRILNLASTSGDLGSVYEKVGNDLGGLNDLTASWREKIYSTAQSTGLFIKQVDDLAEGLGRLPGALDQTISGTDGVGVRMNLLQATATLASGTMRTHKDVLKDLSDVYLKFNLSGSGALELLAGISSTSQDLKLPLEIVNSAVKDVANSFADMGDNTEGALKILQRFGPSLRDANIAPEQIKATVESIASGLKSMDIGQKAFLSRQSGGPGGLAGGYKIESLIQQGKIDEVQKMAETALRKQFGGKIVSLDEASKSEGAAAQFTKQVALLKSGAFGGMAKTDADAYRLLEAFRKGTGAESIKGAKDPQQALEQAMNRGNAALLRNRDQMVILGNQLELNARAAAENTLANRRSVTGTTGSLSAGLKSSVAGYTTEAAGIGITSNKIPGLTKSEADNRQLEETKKMTGEAIDTVKSFGAAAVGGFNKALQSVKDVKNSNNDLPSKEKSEIKPDLYHNFPHKEKPEIKPDLYDYSKNNSILARESLKPNERAASAQTILASASKENNNTSSNNTNQVITTESHFTLTVPFICPTCHTKHMEKIVTSKHDELQKENATRSQLGYVNR